MFQKIAVIGAGTMGNGIAHCFAQEGFNVHLIDVNAEQLIKALQAIRKNLDRQVTRGSISEEDSNAAYERISTFTQLESGVKDVQLVIEAASEDLQIKLNIFKALDAHAPKDCILASNTSSLSITTIASATARPDKVIGMHFMNPVPVMKLVEIINGYQTSEEVTRLITELCSRIKKIPATSKDYPGFIANRILMPMINEAISALHEGVGDVESIDTVMKLGMAHPMGPLQLADFIGLDICLNILRVLHDGFGNPRYAPSPLLVNLVAAGKLGVKTGEGFYKYESGSKDLRVSAFMARI
ncbi:3-hydroxyacyl-CoA dehydrogenase family protein [Flavihumibacter petaseus]|uniref:3-hydroxybutyryl-CoA dehydrogenase n=1 Tax=Flavihumibacter petaseus NBRC 106054 TaxID=1220578 RepID=A0A0E9N6W4_9BACT|nr:3-hydroxyacyl-CoA dehydrogenase NAD-binding domain-containing protein [Flavihumibacter petaseus]GAO45543.1 3-hydroxybutyryl-CoA dehydrogenase [Flavihumibacter petaseus NBRC 106054]